MGFGPQFVDLDGNGAMDLLSGSWPGEIYWFRRKANGVYAEPEKVRDKNGQIIKAGRATAVALADWDADGDLDLVVGNIEGAVFLHKNEGKKTKPAFGGARALEASGSSVKAAGGDAGPCLADWDADGRTDLLLGSGSGAVVWYRNIGSATEPKLATPVTLVKEKPMSGDEDGSFDRPTQPGTRTKVSVCDWNGDGKMDLLVGDFNGSGTSQRKYHGWVWVFLRKAPVQAATGGS